jgi:hypothetical protein
MIATLITAMDAVAAQRLPAAARHGLAELRQGDGYTIVVVFDGTSFQPIQLDSKGNWAYWRINDRLKERKDARFDACNGMLTMDVPLRLVTLTDRELCPRLPDIARAAASDLRRMEPSLRTALQAAMVEVSINDIETNSDRVFAAEIGGKNLIPDSKALVSIDLVVTITGREECFDVCGTPASLLCVLVQGATDAALTSCIGEERLAEICGGGEACPMTVRIYLNGVLEETILNVDPCVNNTVNINGNV